MRKANIKRNLSSYDLPVGKIFKPDPNEQISE